VIVFRLGSSRHPANDGIGASLYGGRWNHKGTAVIYTAESRSLCALEILANADELADDYVATPIEMPDELDITRDIGTNWQKALATAVLSVPSAVIPRERNYILNPAHPDFNRIRFSSPEPFYFDDRLGRARLK